MSISKIMLLYISINKYLCPNKRLKQKQKQKKKKNGSFSNKELNQRTIVRKKKVNNLSLMITLQQYGLDHLYLFFIFYFFLKGHVSSYT